MFLNGIFRIFRKNINGGCAGFYVLFVDFKQTYDLISKGKLYEALKNDTEKSRNKILSYFEQFRDKFKHK